MPKHSSGCRTWTRGKAGGGKGGYSTTVYTERLRSKVQPLPFHIPFSMKKVSLSPFVYLLLTNDTPLKYHVWNFAFLLTAVNALSFK